MKAFENSCEIIAPPVQLRNGAWLYVCLQCGPWQLRQRPQNPVFPCRAKQLDAVSPETKGLYLQPAAEKLGVSPSDLMHYAGAIVRWGKAGFPVREQVEVERIERDLCRPCKDYRAGRCKVCGCHVNTSAFSLVNKIKMATEHCKKKKW